MPIQIEIKIWHCPQKYQTNAHFHLGDAIYLFAGTNQPKLSVGDYNSDQMYGMFEETSLKKDSDGISQV